MHQVKTNIGKQFLLLIDKHFKKQRKDNLHKLINRHTIEIYSFTKIMESIMSSHNKKNKFPIMKATNIKVVKERNVIVDQKLNIH